MSTDIIKLEMVLNSISELCEKATTGNFAHKMATIKHQVNYAKEQLTKIQNDNVEIFIDKLCENLEFNAKAINIDEVKEMMTKAFISINKQ